VCETLRCSGYHSCLLSRRYRSWTSARSSAYWGSHSSASISPRKFWDKSYPCNRPWRPIKLWDVEAPTFFNQSAHRSRWGCQPHVLVALHPAGRFLVLISVRGWIDPRVIVRLERLGQLKKFTSSGLEPVTFRLVSECLNQLRYRVPRKCWGSASKYCITWPVHYIMPFLMWQSVVCLVAGTVAAIFVYH
jgi:MoaA/NifB/PqqE/SkfB family radical SAM enzyme